MERSVKKKLRFNITFQVLLIINNSLTVHIDDGKEFSKNTSQLSWINSLKKKKKKDRYVKSHVIFSYYLIG